MPVCRCVWKGNCRKAKTVNCARRKMYGWIFGQGFNSPRLHHSLSRKVIYNKKALLRNFLGGAFVHYETILNYILTSINYYQSSKEESNCYTCTKTPAYKTSRGLCVKFRIWINYSFQLGFLRRLTHCITTISAEMMIKELQQSV